MIVVIGQPVLGHADDAPVATGSAACIALAAAARGAAVQLVGKVGEDADGEALVLALTQGHVGHVALLRDPAHPTPVLLEPEQDPDAARLVPAERDNRPGLDAGDLELALRYLTEFRVVVLADELDGASVRVVADAASWCSAPLIALVPEGRHEPPELPPDAIVLEAPAGVAEGAVDRLVGELAAAIDAGADSRTAFREIVANAGWEPSGA